MADMKQLEKTCRQIRTDILKMINKAGSGHPGGSLSAVELLVGLYFGGVMNICPEDPEWEGRDRLILSKGHAAPVLYSVLARRGFFPCDWMNGLRTLGSPLQGHPHSARVPGMDCSSGSLGQGLSVANGIAIGLKKRNNPARVYCLMGDGELQEGQIWEAAMTAAQYGLDNVCGIVDWNHLQLDGTVEEIMDVGDLALKWRDFGWKVIECDGHDIASVLDAFAVAEESKGSPGVVLAHTIKGKGVSFMENQCSWHGTAPDDKQLVKALAEIEC